MATAATPGQGDDMLRQVGIKIWVDGSPWIGNIALSFPYLDTAATRTIGVTARLLWMRQLHQRTADRNRRGLLPTGLADGLPCARRRRRRHDPRRVRRSACAAIRATTIGCGSSTSAPSGMSNCSAPQTSGSPAASSSTRSTTGVTSSSTVCSGPSADPVGCQQDPRWPPACAFRCTTTRRSPPRSRCATSAWP